MFLNMVFFSTHSLGSCCHGAHFGCSPDDAGELHWPDSDRTLSGCQPQRPPQVVSAGWTLQDSVRLHQETHHQHEVRAVLHSCSCFCAAVEESRQSSTDMFLMKTRSKHSFVPLSFQSSFKRDTSCF